MTRRKSRKTKVTKGEILLYVMASICLIATFSMKIFGGAKISNLSMTAEKVRYDIESQSKKNESLVMKVNELTSFENVKTVVDDMGLAYNNENVIVINND